jgi:beta-lactamase regulating signal transducer with metallopeptidase domain
MTLPSTLWIERVGIALLHSLWQGALVGLALLVLLPLLRHATAQTRYVVCCLALTIMLAIPVGTLLAVRPEAAAPGTLKAPDESALVKSAAAALETVASYLPQEMPVSNGAAGTSEASESINEGRYASPSTAPTGRRWISSPAESLLLALVAAWSAGVVLLSCRVLGGYVVARRLTFRRIEPLDEPWQVRFQQLALRLGVRIPIEIWQSACVEAPIVVGCFRPVVLVPIGIASGLSVAQMEAILAHELAHIRRYDFLINAVQCLIETLLFYHPCAWWISTRIRAEREHCCDDLAVAACGDALVYARALSRLEDWRGPSRLALALTGSGGLLVRIRRIVGQRRASDAVGGWLAGSLAVVVPLVVGATWAYGRAAQRPAAVDAPTVQTAAESSSVDSLDEIPLSLEKTTSGDEVTTNDDPHVPATPQAPSVHFLMPTSPFGRRFPGPRGDPLESMYEEHDPDRVVKVSVLGLPGDVYDEVYTRLRQILPNLGFVGSGAGDTATVYLAPISDLDFFASHIDFGQVTSIDHAKREITVVADHARLPLAKRRSTPATAGHPPADVGPTDLTSLTERLIRHDHSAVEGLVALGAEAESTTIELVSQTDRRVRRDALLVLKKIASGAALPAAVRALADSDLGNRDLAWQVICRLPGALEDRAVIEAAAAGLERDGEQAAKWLASIGPAAERVVAPYAEHTQADVRRHAVAVLATIAAQVNVAQPETAE